MAKIAKFIALFLAICVFEADSIQAQQLEGGPGVAVDRGGAIKILVLEGQGAVNNVQTQAGGSLVVEVRDENDRPVEGATVDFQMPLMGPSASFEGGVRNKRVTTNLQGQVSASYTPNMEKGRFTIQVTAKLGNSSGTTTITQRNALANEPVETSTFHRHKKMFILAGVAVAGGVVAAILLSRGGGSTSGATGSGTITITPGIPSVGGPH